MSQSKTVSTATGSGRWRFRTVALLCAVVTVIGLWATDSFSQYCNHRIVLSLQRDQLDEALAWLNWSEACRDGNPETLFWKSRLLRKSGRFEEYAQELERYLDVSGDRLRVQREKAMARASFGEAENLMQELADMLVQQEGDGDELCSSYANGFIRVNEYQQAFVLIDHWKTAYPLDPRPHYMNGKVQDHLSNWPVAEREYREALAKQPDHYPSAYSLGRLLLANNHPVEALAQFETCRAMKYNAAPLIGMAKCLRQNGQTEAARECLKEALTHSAENRALSFQRLHETEEGNTAEVELGNLELAAGNFESALEHLSIAYAANPRDLDLRYSRAVALRQSGKKDEGAKELEATNAARQALAEADRIVDLIDPLKPQVPERLQIGEIYLHHGSLQTARFWIESALAHDSSSDKGRQLRAELDKIEQDLRAPTSNLTSP